MTLSLLWTGSCVIVSPTLIQSFFLKYDTESLPLFYRPSIGVAGNPTDEEQLGWPGAALRSSPVHGSRGIVYCKPDVKGIQVQNRNSKEDGSASGQTAWSCHVTYDLEQLSEKEVALKSQGFCWGPLFWNPILVGGYPILTRPEPDTGLEMSLRTMAFLLRSQYLVQWGGRIVLKGFSSLVVATLTTAGVVVWHLLSSRSADERISYTDPKVEALSVDTHKGLSLRDLETRRHIIGWCAYATDVCGMTLQQSPSLNILD
jgi:hypothetical protein